MRDRIGKISDLRRTQREAMVSHGAGYGRRTLDDIQTVQRRLPVPSSAPSSKAHAGGSTAEKVGLERQYDLGLVEAILRHDLLSEGATCTGEEIIPVHRLVLMPF